MAVPGVCGPVRGVLMTEVRFPDERPAPRVSGEPDGSASDDDLVELPKRHSAKSPTRATPVGGPSVTRRSLTERLADAARDREGLPPRR